MPGAIDQHLTAGHSGVSEAIWASYEGLMQRNTADALGSQEVAWWCALTSLSLRFAGAGRWSAALCCVVSLEDGCCCVQAGFSLGPRCCAWIEVSWWGHGCGDHVW